MKSYPVFEDIEDSEVIERHQGDALRPNHPHISLSKDTQKRFLEKASYTNTVEKLNNMK